MKKTILFAFALLMCSLMAFTTVKTVANDCEILHEGTFIYGDSEEVIKVVIDGENHTEYHNNGKYIIQSKLDWVNDCEYNMTMQKVTIPNFPYEVGDVMNIKVDKIEGNNILYTATLKGQKWRSFFVKVEE
ncbi:MAG: hypothetical protein AB8B65_05855 [Kordia sp.]|uniref:hypothetical protein n=1 Tax=Kordia sp. TaxID=1965332 RepID=UPI00385DB11A